MLTIGAWELIDLKLNKGAGVEHIGPATQTD